MLYKCKECNGCLTYTWIYGQLLVYCTLCRIVYKVRPGKTLEKVEDQSIINLIFSNAGNTI